MCHTIEAFSMKLLTCISDLKTPNLHASFCYTLPMLWCCITWQANLLTESDLNHEKSVLKMLEGQHYHPILVQGTSKLLVSIKISCHTENFKDLQGMLFRHPGALSFPYCKNVARLWLSLFQHPREPGIHIFFNESTQLSM